MTTNVIKTINKDEVKALTHAASGVFAKRDAAIVGLLVNTGLRVSELRGLNVVDVLNRNGDIRTDLKVRKAIAKGGRERIIPLNAKAKDCIGRLLAFNEGNGYSIKPISPLLVSRKHGRLTRQQIHRVISGLAERAGLSIDVHPHTLRHVFATAVLKKTNNLRVVQSLLGHRNISTTCLYTHPSRDDLANAVSAL